ncbi:uncharacterized protein BX663DRAFT_509158 [Cokeromyces recurvatus]|uniref:uncharacterized protein n=1 Tax=Cokeromyces recurvatus TaxID=90255 RepID=UPI002220233F|nr:uncharacterized protein BX663DRAFT_509158 [Cokeromyces recurvatus]KAI7902999.1 hypothetical protein BX663DRAFT_509158 [Cokeromyces recurvatus]
MMCISTVKQYTSVFDTTTAQSFATWCRNKKQVYRELSVLDEAFYDELVASITTYLPRYQGSLKALIRDGIELVGYARKSPTDDDIENNTRLIQLMVSNLKVRSFATRIYVSTSSWASTPFAKRDLKPDSKVMESLENVNGNTQDLLEYINSCDHDICLISIGFAGLTTRSSDLVNLIEKNPAIKKIAIETFAINNEVFIFDAQNLQNNKKILDRFDYRNEFYNRSK